MGLVSAIMKNLLDFVFCAVLLTVCFGQEFEGGSLESDDISIGKTAGQSLKCPGICQMEPCATSLPDADCEADKTCCLDHLEKISATEFAESEFTTESLLDSSLVQEVETGEIPEEIAISMDEEQLAEEETSEVYLEDVESSQSKESPEYVYSQIAEDDYQQTGPINYEVIDEGSLSYTSSDPYETSFAQNFKCPGRCTPSDRLTECSHLYSDTRLCPYGTVCCFEDHSYEQQRGPAGRSVEQVQEYNCPGSCMHPSHMMFCERVLSQYTCPLNSKCCMLPTALRSQTKEPIECTGTCLPFHMNGYCLPPNEIVMGPTTCEQGSSCCMLNPKNTQPPRFKAMAFPSQTTSTNIDVTSNLLGHLAVDDAGNVFKVSKNGLISPLKIIPNGFNTHHLIRLANYPRINGDIVIYSSPTGELFQQFIPRQSSQTPIRQPIRQFDSQASEQSTNYQTNIAEKDQSDVNRDNVMDIVIPDDDDEAPVTKNSPVVHSDKSSRPPCPGSCMSYFLRFTCFRGYAIYDGFTCPGRGVCCARLKEIEEHEQYLKSLSPYFNAPPASRDSTVTRCGIKGRRDTPRIIGGKDALSGEWCWQVAIINVQNQYLCGGALIDNSWVLTAAHCVVSSLEEGQALFIRAGVTDLKSKEDNSQSQTIRVLSIFIHHNFNSRNLDNNIALLRLQKPVELSSFVCVVCLPTNKIMPTDGTKCTVTGFGFVAPEGGMSLRIREAKVPIVDDVECMSNVTEALELPFIIPSSSFCAGGAGAEDACQGDAGGALACEVSGFHELIGLVSWGLGCGKDDVPSIYVKIPAFMGWINQIISSSSFVLPSSQV